MKDSQLLYDKGFEISEEICYLYEQLKEETEEENAKRILKDIQSLIVLENAAYKRLTINEVKIYLANFEQIKEQLEADNLILAQRYKYRLIFSLQTLTQPKSLIQDYPSASFIPGTMVINAISKMNQTFNQTITYNLEEETKIENLKEMLKYFKYETLSVFTFSENHALKYGYDLNLMPQIDPKTFNQKKYHAMCIQQIGMIISSLIKTEVEEDSLDEIFYALFDNFRLETLLSILNKNELKVVLFLTNKFLEGKEHLPQVHNIKDLIRQKIKNK